MTFHFRACLLFALAAFPLPCARLLADGEASAAAGAGPAVEAAKAEEPAAAGAPAESADSEAEGGGNGEAEGGEDGEETSVRKRIPFSRYQPIVDRQPFGRPPASFDPDRPGEGASGDGAAAAEGGAAAAEFNASEEEQRIISSVRVCMLNRLPGGTIAVGFVDSSRQPAGNYYLEEGESRDGWTFKSADLKEWSVVLEQNGVEATIKLGDSAGGAAPGAKGGRRSPAPGRLAQGRPNGAAPAAAGPAAGGGALPGGLHPGSLRARRAQREAERKAAADALAAATAQAKAERERVAAEREQFAAEREQQREALLQLKEELARQREERQNQAAAAAQQGETPPEGQNQE